MRQYFFGGQIYTEQTLTALASDLDSVFKKGGIDVNTTARIKNGKLVVSIPLSVQAMSEDDIPIVLQSLILGRKNSPGIPYLGEAVKPIITTDLASIDDFYREAAREAGLQRYGHVRSIQNTPSGIEITIG